MLNMSDFSKCIKQFLKEERDSLLNNSKNMFNHFSATKTDNGYSISCFNKQYVTNFINENIDTFSHLPMRKDILKLLREPQIFVNPNKVINICYFDALVFQMLPEEEQNFWMNKLPIIQRITEKKFNRAKIFEVNKSAISFDRNTKNKRYKEIIQSGFNFVEFPQDFRVSNLISLTNNISALAKEKNVDNFSISLRIKKLGLYKSKGFYSKETNTMFLDPRHLEVWRHELGHYFYSKNGIRNIEEEEFADNF